MLSRLSRCAWCQRNSGIPVSLHSDGGSLFITFPFHRRRVAEQYPEEQSPLRPTEWRETMNDSPHRQRQRETEERSTLGNRLGTGHAQSMAAQPRRIKGNTRERLGGQHPLKTNRPFLLCCDSVQVRHPFSPGQ